MSTIQPTSLRGVKRARTRDRILANAIALFRDNGVRATKLSAVSAASEVSTATLYNYFATKGDLAAAWLRGEIRERLETAVEASDRSRLRLRPILRRVVASLAEDAAAEPGLRAEAWHEAGRSSLDPPSGWSGWVACLIAEQESERIRRDVAPTALAGMIADAIEGGLVDGLRQVEAAEGRGEPATLIEHALRERLDLVLDGARKRNERVRPPTAPVAGG